MNTTTKKIKVIGTQDYINPNTGEYISMQVTRVEDRDFNFSKVWMHSFLSTLDIVGNQKTKVAFWVIENVNRENMLPYTYRQISEATKISLETVRKTMTILLEADFLRRINQGCYIVNPNVIYKGTHNARLNILTQYNDLNAEKPTPPTPEERLRNITLAIKRLMDEASKLEEEINCHHI